VSKRRAWLGLVLAMAVAFPAGCGEVIVQPIGAAPSDGGLSGDVVGDRPADSPATGDDGTFPIDSPSDAPTDAPSFCQGHGAVLPGTDLCSGDLANLFRFAACACTSFDVSGVLTTDSLDSTADAGSTQVASVAADQALSANSTTTIGGSVWAGGAGLMGSAPAVYLSGTAPGLVAHDIQSGGPVEIGGPYTVEGDVWSNGDVTIDASGSLQVGGTVHLSPGDTATGVTASGGIAMTPTPVAVPPPCDCSSPINIGKIVADYASPTLNTNASLTPPLATTALDNPSSPVTLPCGLFYVDGIHGGSVTLNITGRVALFVGGDLSVTQGIVVTLAAGAELDLFIAGNVNIQGPPGSVELGDVTHAALTRVYVGGGGDDAGGGFTLSADATLSANIYAPSAVVEIASDFVLRGAIFAQALQFSGNFAIHYDTAVLQVSQTSGCQPPAGSCMTCNDCAGATPACKGGQCVPCVTTSDCCAPLECNTSSGQCLLPTQ
jgi:hypothetical protein